jgi:uncharacterized protein (DUF983 family)
MFAGYLTPAESCSVCGLAFEPLRADDAPAYFTIFIVGHIVVGGLLMTEKAWHPPMLLEAAVWLPAILVFSMGLLPFVKGAVMGIIYASQRGARHHPAE